MIAAVAGFLSTRQESLGRMTTFEREVGTIFKMAAHANERLRILQLQTGIMLVLTAIQRRKKREEQIVRRKHRFWVREIFQNRQNCGTFHTLVQEVLSLILIGFF